MNMNSLRFVALRILLWLVFVCCLILVQVHRYESAVRVVFGNIKLNKPPPASKTATINVGAGQYKSSSCAMTMFPMIPPSRALIIDMATPVALERNNSNKTRFYSFFVASFSLCFGVMDKHIS